jgi:hypothetical protein
MEGGPMNVSTFEDKSNAIQHNADGSIEFTCEGCGQRIFQCVDDGFAFPACMECRWFGERPQVVRRAPAAENQRPAPPRVARVTPNTTIARLRAQMHQTATILDALADGAWDAGLEATAATIKRQTKALRTAADAN